MSNVHLILDEAAVLGKMDVIDDAVGIGRGYGIRFIFIYQSFGQLKKCFPDGQEQTLLSNCSQIYFAVNDNDTAELVSTRLGEQTLVLASGGTSRGTSWNGTSGGGQSSRSYGGSFNANNNWALQVRRLLKPDEIIALPSRLAITFTPGVRPVFTWLLRHYEEGNLLAKANAGHRRHGPGRALARSTLLLVTLLGFAWPLTAEIFRRADRGEWPAANGGWSDQVEGGPDVRDATPAVVRQPEGREGRGPGRRPRVEQPGP